MKNNDFVLKYYFKIIDNMFFKPMKDPMLLVKAYLEEKVLIKLRDNTDIEGVLHGFDEHLNVLIENENFMFIRGECILSISQK